MFSSIVREVVEWKKNSISSGATSECYYTCFIYNLPSCDYFIREDKKKILQRFHMVNSFFFFKRGIPDGSERKNLPARRETWFRSLGREEGNGNPLQYFCLENSTDRGDWRAIVHEVTKSQT